MLRISTLSIAILTIAVTVSNAEAAYCGQTFDVASARTRWAVVRHTSVDPDHHDEACRAYGTQFFEAVTARETASNCEANDTRHPPTNS